MDFWLDNINSEDLASDCGQESVVYVECLGREDDGPETQDGPGGPAGDLDQEQEAAGLGHGRLVLGEGDGPPLGRLLLLDLFHTFQKQYQPEIIRTYALYNHHALTEVKCQGSVFFSLLGPWRE